MLVSDRTSLVRQWRQDLAAFEVMMERTRLELDAELGRFDMLASTRQRLERIASANHTNRATVSALFADVGLTADPIALQRADQLGAESTRIVRYFEQVLRDWGWPGSAQNHASLERLTSVAGHEMKLGRTLVLGAGAGRLAYDLHHALSPELTLALDLDPFVLLVAHSALFGSGAALIETPIDPAGPNDAALPRELRRDGNQPKNFALLLADAFEPPFEAATFDTVVTPWFIDVAAEDFRDVLGLVSYLLRPGGRWLNDGPLLYETSSFDLRFSRQEVLELLELAGFRVDAHTASEMTYLRSPASAHARTESVLTFSAGKLASPASDGGAPVPSWVILRHLKVPAFVQSVPSGPPVVAKVLSLVDGARSITDIAEIIAQLLQPPPGMTVVDIVSGLLLNAYRDLRRG
ncbi:MAG TPA: hypothetical protein VIW29_15235 [Polyangiaceae bacterium]